MSVLSQAELCRQLCRQLCRIKILLSFQPFVGPFADPHFLQLDALLQGALRTRETIEKFKRVPPQPGQTSPLLVYFGTLLTKGKLNAYEGVELSQLVISQNKKHLLDAWFKVGPVQSPC